MDPDLIDLLRAFASTDVRFMVVGGYAVGVHGHVRATKDLDVWVEASVENAPRVIRALRSFGAPLAGLTETELRTPGKGLMIGVPPRRIDVITKIDGVTFEAAWPGRVEARFSDVLAPVIGRADLLANKRAAARPQDLADVAALEQFGDPAV